MTATEYVVLVDQQNNVIGQAEKLAAHAENLLHRAFSVFIFRREPRLELLLQQRALDKYHSQGLWTNSCCSHPRMNEDITVAGKRRLKEELNLETPLIDLGWFHYNAHFANGLSENEIDHVLLGFIAGNQHIQPNPQEVNDYRWIRISDLEAEIKTSPSKFTPWLSQALQIVQQHLD